jgi:hypothetical protein
VSPKVVKPPKVVVTPVPTPVATPVRAPTAVATPELPADSNPNSHKPVK